MSYDPYADQVVALLHFDGADGSTNFPDETGLVWTPYGGAQIKTAVSKFGGASGTFNGIDAYLATLTALRLGTSDFTIELQIYPLESPSGNAVLTTQFAGSTTVRYAIGFSETVIGNKTGDLPFFGFYDGSWHGLMAPAPLPIATWTHVAVTRQGITYRLFIAGQLVASKDISVAMPINNAPTWIGRRWDNTAAASFFHGCVDETRITAGVARYTANFTPPAQPFLLDKRPPNVDAPSLISGTQSLSGTVTLAVHPSDDTGVVGVQFELDGAPLGAEVLAAPWQIIWDTTAVADGGHVITAVVRDAADNKTTSDPTQYNVKNNFEAPSTLPQCAITAPANGAVLVGTIPVTAAASDTGGIESVQFKLDDSLLGAAIAAPPFTVDLDTTTVPDGTHVIKAIATDTDGNTTTDSITVVISNEQPARAPVSIEVRQYREQLRAHLPPGPALADEGQGQLTNLMDGLAYEFSRIDARGAALIDEADPRTTDELLADWERLTGLPDACTPAGQTTAQRRGAVVARLTANNVPSIPALIAQADALGYTVTIVERHARRYRDPLGGLYGGDAWQFTWEVHVQGVAAAPDLECIMRRYAPAHTIVHFIYE